MRTRPQARPRAAPRPAAPPPDATPEPYADARRPGAAARPCGQDQPRARPSTPRLRFPLAGTASRSRDPPQPDGHPRVTNSIRERSRQSCRVTAAPDEEIDTAAGLPRVSNEVAQ